MILKTLSLSFTLFLLMDSLGNIPLFLAILKNFSAKRQRKIIAREMLIALAIIVVFLGLGDIVLSFLNVQSYTILISGGIILFLIALKMIFPQAEEKNSTAYEREKEPFIVPLATPLVAGPAVLAAVMLYAKQQRFIVSFLAIIIAWLISFIVLISSSHLQKLLGPKGLIACERLMGLILTLLAVQMFLQGLTSYVALSCIPLTSA